MSEDYPQDNNQGDSFINFLPKNIEDFLELIWGYTSVDAKCFSIMWIDRKGEKDYKVYCIKNLVKEKRKSNRIVFVGDRIELFHTAAKDLEELGKNSDYHVFYRVLPLSDIPDGRGSSAFTKVGKVLWADLDFKDIVTKGEEKCKELNDHGLDCYYREGSKIIHVKRPSLSSLLKLEIPPSLVIDSGTGYHFYWFLKEEVDAKTIAELENNLISYLEKHGYPVDEGTRDLARVLRVPFTINPRLKRDVSIIPINIYRIYDVNEIGRVLQREEEKVPLIAEDNLRVLKESELNEIIGLIKPAYVPGKRHNLILYLSGWFAKARIHPVQMVKIAKILYDDTGDEDSFENDRLNAIRDSYVKDGIDIRKYKDDIEKMLGDKNLRLDKEPTKEPILGKSGVQAILEEVLGEGKALEIIRRIEEILQVASPYRDTVFELVDFEKQIYALANLKSLILARAKKKGDEMIYKEKVANVAPTKVVVYDSPIDGEIRKYEVTFEGKTLKRPLKLPPMTVEEIAYRLKAEGFVYHERLIKDVLNAVLQAFVRKGKAEIKENILSPGFFIVDGKLISNNWVLREISTEELKEALLLLNELAEWYKHVIDRFSLVIKHGIIQPFIYARKQLGREYQVPDLILYGERNTGKTTLAEIAAVFLWGLDRSKQSLPFSEANTEARFGRILNTSTFGVVLNECNSMFYRNEIINLMKSKVENLIARGAFEKVGKYKQYLALAPVVYTLNPSPPVDFDTLELIPKTALLLEFTALEKITDQKMNEFRKVIEPKLNKLSAIGHWVAKKLLNNPDLLKKNWVELAEELISAAYKEAGLEVPYWVSIRYEGKKPEEVIEEKRLKIIETVRKEIQEYYKNNIDKLLVLDDRGDIRPVNREDVTLEEKINALTKNGLIPWVIRKDDTLIITTGILGSLNKLQVSSLKDLAEILGIPDKYKAKKSIKIGKLTQSISCLELNLEEFAELLTPIF